jgi:hypothetical protein
MLAALENWVRWNVINRKYLNRSTSQEYDVIRLQIAVRTEAEL